MRGTGALAIRALSSSVRTTRRGLAGLALVATLVTASHGVGAPRATTPPTKARTTADAPDANVTRGPHPTPRRGRSPFESREACEAVLTARSKQRPATPHRIASWNIRWFPDGAARGPGKHATDLDWLACTIVALDVQVVAVQEIVQHVRGRAALLDLLDRLDARTAGKWQHALDDCPGSGRQHVGFLWDAARVRVTGAEAVAALNPGDHACGKNLRPGYGVHARFADGVDVHLVVVHLDSGTTARDHGNRAASLSRLALAASELTREGDPDILVLGDFNTMGCKDCEPEVDAAADVAALDASAAAADMKRLDADVLCTAYHGSRPALLDHVLARGPGVLAPDARVTVDGACRDLGCRPRRRGERPASLERLSDHCPLVVELPAPPTR